MMKNLTLVAFLLVAQISFSLKVRNIDEFTTDKSAITEIDLSNKGLIEFPKEILECKNLQKLNLSNNGFIKIPIELGELTELKEVDFSDNPGLSVLDLETLFDSARFSLTNLDLSSCNLIYLPASIESQSKLKRFDVSSNQLFKIPYSLMTLDKLSDVDVSANNITDISWIVNYWWSLKRLNVSGNKNFKVSSLLLSLSYFDRLEKLVVSNIDYIPSEFQYLSVDELEIRNSVIENFRRSDLSSRIKRLVFDNCIFKDPGVMAETISKSCRPDYIGFNAIEAQRLVPFLSVEADSVSVQNAGISDISPLAKVENLKWLDVRGNNVSKKSIEIFKQTKPKITLLFKEMIKPNFGIKPPIQKFVAEPIKRTFSAKEEQQLVLGKAKVTIPQNSILDQNGEVYKGEVNLEYNEYTNPVEIFLSGIAMTSTEDDETLMLSSGGMINIQATDDKGNPLSVNPENPLKVQMFTDNKDGSMVFWEMNEKGIWDDVGIDTLFKPFELDQDKMDSVMNQDFMDLAKAQVQFIGDRYVPKVKKNRKLGTFEIIFEEYPTNRHTRKVVDLGDVILVPDYDFRSRFLCGKSFVFDGDSVGYYYTLFNNINQFCKKQYKKLKVDGKGKKFFTENGPNFISRLELTPDFENDRMLLSFKYMGKFISFPFLFNPDVTNTNVAIRDMQMFYKEYVKSDKKTERSKRRFLSKLNPILRKQERMLKIYAERNEMLRQQFYYDSLLKYNDITGQASIQREFSLNGFGLFNCDVRSRMVKPTNIGLALIDAENAEQVKEKIIGATLIDHTKNGTLQYAPGEDLYLDKASKSTIIFFFSATLVGIYQSWKHRLTGDYTEIKMLDISDMPREEFVKSLTPDV